MLVLHHRLADTTGNFCRLSSDFVKKVFHKGGCGMGNPKIFRNFESLFSYEQPT
jgi:hypothetical protein